jgi:hypothetical protein
MVFSGRNLLWSDKDHPYNSNGKEQAVSTPNLLLFPLVPGTTNGLGASQFLCALGMFWWVTWLRTHLIHEYDFQVITMYP